MGWQRRLSPLTESTFGRSYLRTVGGDLGEKIHRLGVASALLDQARHGIAALAPALVAGDLQRIELAQQVVEDDRTVAGQRASGRVDIEGASAVS